MRISLPTAKRKARIEIIPLIDIVFFLLATFVMVSMSMVKNQGVPVRLPSAQTAVAEDRKVSVTISVTEKGEIYFDQQNVPADEVKTRLGQLFRDDPELKVFINGDENASFGKAIGILDDVRVLGIKKVSIQTQDKKK